MNVDDLGEDEIYVRRSWSKYDGFKCCKNGEELSAPISISHQLYLKLKMLADFNPHGNGFIFYSTVKGKPMDSKKFDSRDETIEYEQKIQLLDSRQLTDGEYFAAFLKLDEIRRSNPTTQGSSDELVGQQLNKSDRQVCKMREIAKKADASLLEKIQNGSISNNKAHEMIKAAEARNKAGVIE